MQYTMRSFPVNLLFRMYHAGKVGLNYLIDREIELNNLILMDYYARSSPQRWQGVKSLVKFSGEYAYLAQDMPRLPVMRLMGKDWSIIYAGRGQSLKMIQPLFFKGDVSIQDLGRIPVWKLPNMIDQWSREGAGLVILETSRAHKTETNVRFVFRVPAWIQQVVDLPDPLEAIFERPEVEKDFRRVLKRMDTTEITYSFSASQVEFDHFYHELYRPFILSRHGEFALVTPYEDMLRWFRRGGLILIHGKEDSRPLGGVVVYLAGKIAYAIESGFVNNQNLWQQGLNPFLYWSLLSWAKSQGAEQVDLGGSFPVRTHGVFIQKRRWGAKVAPRKRITTSLEFHLGQLTPELETFINQVGLITEIQEKNYGLVLGCYTPRLSENQISGLVRHAGRDGLAGIAYYHDDGSHEIFENS